MPGPHGLVHALLASLALTLAVPASAQTPQSPGDIAFEDEAIIEVTLNGVPLRLEVEPSLAGPPIVNPDIIAELGLLKWSNRDINFGGRTLTGYVADAVIDFGFGAQAGRVAWSPNPASTQVDGVIGVHSLPYDRVTFALNPPQPLERPHRFKLKRKRARNYTRLGTEIRIEKKTVFIMFSRDIGPNLISAPTANFLATHREGGFVPRSDSYVDMVFDVRRQTRDMRLAAPIVFGDLTIDRFAVRFADHGRANKVGDIEDGDPRFSDSHILVSRRKRQGKPDPLTHIGRDQLARCSRLTFDLKAKMGELSCVPNPDRIE
ncbi:MAG: hypothetical protein AAGA34_01195 [Pseudomonadota bacterium]